MNRSRRRKALPQEPVALQIENLSHEGRGVARHQGKVIFVDQALPGETVKAKLTYRKAGFDQAVAISVEAPSPDRVDPPCVYAGTCGGCSLQHMESKAQIAFKQDVLNELLLKSLGHNDYQQLPALTGPVSAYRRKARLAVRYVAGKERVLVGFREKFSSYITDMKSCTVLDADVNRLLEPLSELIGNLNNFRQIPQIEVACGDATVSGERVALIIRHLAPLNEDDLSLVRAFAETHGVGIFLQPAGMESIKRFWPDHMPERLHYNLPEFNLTMAFHPADFTQVNADINQRMLLQALELLQLNSKDTVLDLFCGLGNFTLPIATRCKHVTGVEGVETMVERGYENASANGIGNADFICADLFKAGQDNSLPDNFTKVLLDPPRSGALEILPYVAGKKPERIVYVSCNPATLARDAGILKSHGYALKAAGVMDMFPHTAHVESIALFMEE